MGNIFKCLCFGCLPDCLKLRCIEKKKYSFPFKRYKTFVQEVIDGDTFHITFFVEKTPVTMKILQDTYLHRNDKYNDQLFLNRIMKPYIEQNHCKIAYFNNHFFPNGLLYFHAPHGNPAYLDLQRRFRHYRDVEKGPVAFVHANWMVGIDTKIAAFKKNGLWFL